MTEFGKTPLFHKDELADAGASMVRSAVPPWAQAVWTSGTAQTAFHLSGPAARVRWRYLETRASIPFSAGPLPAFGVPGAVKRSREGAVGLKPRQHALLSKSSFFHTSTARLLMTTRALLARHAKLAAGAQVDIGNGLQRQGGGAHAHARADVRGD